MCNGLYANRVGMHLSTWYAAFLDVVSRLLVFMSAPHSVCHADRAVKAQLIRLHITALHIAFWRQNMTPCDLIAGKGTDSQPTALAESSDCFGRCHSSG